MTATQQANDNPRLAEKLSLSQLTDDPRLLDTPDPVRSDLARLLASGKLDRACCTFKRADGSIVDRL